MITVTGKGAKQRRVPLDADVVAAIDVYLLAERPGVDLRPALPGGQEPAPTGRA